MKSNGIAVIIYGLFVLIGGMIGFAKAHSLASLLMGTMFASALVGSGIAMLKSIKIGYYLASVLSFILLLFFGYRLAMTKSFMPAGMMCVMSLLLLAFLLVNGASKKSVPN